MEDDGHDEKIEVINDEEDDNEEGVLLDTPKGDETVQMDTAAVPQLAQDDDDDVLCLHCTECNLTLASSSNFIRHQQIKRHQSKSKGIKAKCVDAGKAVSLQHLQGVF